MLIATRKKKENIAEYLLYMWQIEDIIRANGLNMESIRSTVIDHFDCSDEERHAMAEWYESLIEMMRAENKQKEGHIQLVANTLIDLNDLHLRLLHEPKFADYAAAYYRVLPFLVELRNKNRENAEISDLEQAFSALYGVLLLKLQKKELTKETAEAARQISLLLALLAQYYRKDNNGELKWEND